MTPSTLLRGALAFAFALSLAACDSADLGGADATGADAAIDGAPAPVSAAVTAAALNGDECSGTVGAISVDKIIVPFGATCTLEGTRVLSDVEVLAGGRLLARGATIGGNVQGDEALNLRVLNSRVAGNVEVVKGGITVVRRATIGGDLVVEDGLRAITLDLNTVRGNAQAQANLGGLTITGNRISGNLQCQDNLPAPTGGGNTAAQKEDQCLTL